MQQLSIGTVESISVIFPHRTILGSPEVMEGQSLIDGIISVRKCAFVSGTVLARKRKRYQSIAFELFLLSSLNEK